MDSINPLKTLAQILKTDFVFVADVAVPIGFQLKLAGIEWHNEDQLAYIMSQMVAVGFLQPSPDLMSVRLNPIYKTVEPPTINIGHDGTT